jgi:hypothetical protein
MDNLSVELSRRTSLVFILIFAIIAVLDSTIVKYFSHSDVQISISSSVTIFILFTTIFAITGIVLLNSVKKVTSKVAYKYPINLRYLHVFAFSTQILMVCILLTIILQIVFLNKYSLFLLNASTYVSHFSALVFMIFLCVMFVSWFKSKGNYTILLYALTFSLIATNIAVSMAYLHYQFSRAPPTEYRKPFPLNSFIISHQTGTLAESFNTVFDILYILSFFSLWISTLRLLNQHPSKLTRIKYYILLSLPLIYYLFPFTEYFSNVFSSWIITSPIGFVITYVLNFSATKQIGALLFSLVFFTGSALVTNNRLRISLLITSIGVVAIFSSIEIVTLQYRIYPPYGLVTEAFIPIGAYMLFIGIFISVKDVSQDIEIRKELYKSAKSQLNLIKTIGTAAMENEFVKKYRDSAKRISIVEDDPRNAETEIEEIREIVRDVLNEVSKTSGKINSRQ